jgi:WD40 repeat protein
MADIVIPSELQILGEQLQSKRIFTLSEYRRSGGKEPLVHGYLEDVIQGSDNSQAAKLLLRSLISDEDARLTLPLEEIARRTQQSPETVRRILDQFVQARLVAQVQDQEPWCYELMHEYLIEKINRMTGKVMDATHRANRLFHQYLSNYSVEKRTRIPLSKLWSIRRYSDMERGEVEQELFQKSLWSGLFHWGMLAVVCIIGSIIAAVSLSITEEWEETRLSDGHTGPARQVAFSPDGKWLISGGEDGAVIVWDFARRVRLRTFREGTGQIRTVAFSGDGRWFASGSSDGTVAIWDASRLEKVVILREHNGPMVHVGFSPDSRLMVSAATDKRILLWRVARWEKLREFPATAGYGNLLFLPNGYLLEGTSRLAWDPVTGQRATLPCVPQDEWNYAALSPDGRRVAGVSSLGKVFFWNQAGCEYVKWDPVHQDYGRAAAWSPDGRWVASGAENIVFWDAYTKSQLARLEASAEVWSLVFSPDSRWLVSSHGDGSILVWDAEKRERVGDFRQHSAPVNAVAFSTDGKCLASGGDDRTVILWDTEHRVKEAVLIGHNARINSLAFSPDGRFLASCDQSDAIIFWDIAGRCPLQTTKPEPGNSPHSLVYSPDGHWIVSSVGVYGTANARKQADLGDGLAGPVYGQSFSSDGKWLARTSPDSGLLAILDTQSWRRVADQERDAAQQALRVVSFSPDDKWLVTGDNQGAVWLWQAKPLRQAALLGRHNDRVKSVAFSPDSRRVVSASDDKTISLWDVQSRRLIAQIGSHTSSVAAVAFSNNGRLASGEWDNSVRIYARHRSLWGHRLN